MQTREDVYSIEARINPLVQMIYVKPPYTSHLDDAKLLTADSVEATQKTLQREEQFMIGVQQRSPFLPTSLSARQPEQDSGHMVSIQG